MERNPFIFGKVVKGEDYCSRKETERRLTLFAKRGQNVCVIGPRRTGKTSLIIRVGESAFNNRFLHADFWGTKNQDDVARTLLGGLLKNQSRRWSLKRLLEFFQGLNIEITVLGTKVTIPEKQKFENFPFDRFFDQISQLAKRQRYLVALDEFQSLMDLNPIDRYGLLGLLRKSIQHQDNVSFIFSGSIHHQMSDIFHDSRSPFYQGAEIMEVGPIQPEETFRQFLTDLFLKGRRTPVQEYWNSAEEVTARIPSDLQRLCSAVWETTSPGDIITEKEVHAGLKRIFAHENEFHLRTIKACTDVQKRCLIAVAKLGGKNVTAAPFRAKVGGLVSSTILRAMQSFEDDLILWKDGREHRFVNPFFREWLRDRY